MVENQNIECQLAEMKENCQDQTFHAFHSSCHSCLILDVCASMLIICYLPYIPYAYDSTCKWKDHCRSVLFPLHPLSVRSFSLLHAHPLHYHICGGTGTKELSASFLIRENAACALFWKPDTKSIHSKSLPQWLRK